MEDSQVYFKDTFIKTVGDGGNTLFWKEHWIGDDKLCNLFPRLFRLDLQPDATIKDRRGDDDFESSAVWRWKREPNGRVRTELDTLLKILSTSSFNCRIKDKWNWSLATNAIFKVKTLSSIIDEQFLGSSDSAHGTIRNKLVPKKLEIFVWRALKGRLPVRVELDKRGIDLHSVRCPLCDDDLESVEHSLVSCKHASEVWDRIFRWWNMGNFNNSCLSNVLGESNNPIAGSNFGKSFWLAIRWIGAYFVWKNRNNMVFRGKCWNPPAALNEIQTVSFEWISNRTRRKKIDWHTWLSNPNVYLTQI
ncbi:uncharacterized protein [Rutidosis leptorrhynchoides]|uniref:uncharacterized protein n=1 Tax=Rutidosis leptorrhynchoides TaxID=125765 RepID=UPI003A9936DF